MSTTIDTPLFQERPKICCLDLNSEDFKIIVESGFNVVQGTLGSKIRVPNQSGYDSHQLLLNFELPVNLHEFDILIIELANHKTRDYKLSEHIRKNHTGNSSTYIRSSFPETVFDPRPAGSHFLKERLEKFGDKFLLLIIFTVGEYEIEYETVATTKYSTESQGFRRYNIYSLTGGSPLKSVKYGKEIKVADSIRQDLKNLLEENIDSTYYSQTFYHPSIWENDKNKPDPRYLPLLLNSSNEIVSIYEKRNNSAVFYFPQIKFKGEFLKSFLNKIGPGIYPNLFPFSTSFVWKNSSPFWLPNYERLESKRRIIEKEFDIKLKAIDHEIESNHNHFSYLHEILTETGDSLVESLIKFLKWLGFSNVVKHDEKDGGKLLEEDIQIGMDNGILIIECKGIGGTSTDSDCSQISKIKHRRCRERGSFDVFALYIVNHQRYLSPLQRKNPPFTLNQIQDAENDERGLLTTWQLFNVFREIEDGILSKEEVRESFLSFGHVKFRPSNLVLIGEPKELFKKGVVCILILTNKEISIGDEVFIERDGTFRCLKIEGIQINDQPVPSAKNGEVGIMLSDSVKKNCKIWKKLKR
ncbi:MAG: hypothetical protein KI791_18395 [Cyclobacteriaceae bacterium]|nr:hypothetical protein [Cyclobacteriaceae bacterium SS2]